MTGRSVDVMNCEIMRAYKVLDLNTIQPVSFIVPRRNKGEFHSELFPPCLSGGSSLVSCGLDFALFTQTAREWLGGRTMKPQLRNMEPGNLTGVIEFAFSKWRKSFFKKAKTSQCRKPDFPGLHDNFPGS